jgi:hypothetical protein
MEEHADLLANRVMEYFAATDDWAWMRPANGTIGFGTGGGETYGALFAGLRAAATTFTMLGREADADQALYLYARAAVPFAGRFAMNEYAIRNGLMDDTELIVGFREGQGPITGSFLDHPGRVVDVLGGYGAHPETLDVMEAVAPDRLEWLVDAVVTAWPNWADGAAAYPGFARGMTNDASVTIPMIAARARLRTPEATLLEELRTASRSPQDWWMAAPVIAEVAGAEAGVWLTDWGKLGLVAAELEGRRLTLVLAAPRGLAEPQTVLFRAPAPPKAWYVDGIAQPNVGWNRSHRLVRASVSAERPSVKVVVFDWSDAAPPDASMPARYLEAAKMLVPGTVGVSASATPTTTSFSVNDGETVLEFSISPAPGEAPVNEEPTGETADGEAPSDEAPVPSPETPTTGDAQSANGGDTVPGETAADAAPAATPTPEPTPEPTPLVVEPEAEAEPPLLPTNDELESELIVTEEEDAAADAAAAVPAAADQPETEEEVAP